MDACRSRRILAISQKNPPTFYESQRSPAHPLPLSCSRLPRSVAVVLGALLLATDAASSPHRPHPHPRGRCWSRGPCGEAGGGGGSRGLGGRGGGRWRWDWRLEEDGVVLDSSSARWSPTVHLQLPCPLLLLPAPYCWRYQPSMDDALIVFDQMCIKVYIVFFYTRSILLTYLYSCALHIY